MNKELHLACVNFQLWRDAEYEITYDYRRIRSAPIVLWASRIPYVVGMAKAERAVDRLSVR